MGARLSEQFTKVLRDQGRTLGLRLGYDDDDLGSPLIVAVGGADTAKDTQ